MAREWTDEQREAQRQRAKAQGLGRRASVVEAPSAEQMMIAQAQQQGPQVLTQDLRNVQGNESMGDDAGTVSHTKANRVRVYKPTAYGFKPKIIPVTNLGMVIKNGWLPHCPDCNPSGLDGADCGDGVNDCPAKEKRQFRVCPVPQCGKRVYDYEQDIAKLEENDPEQIEDDAYMQSTAALRTKAVLDKHMLARHPNEAAAAGIVAPAQRERQVSSAGSI